MVPETLWSVLIKGDDYGPLALGEWRPERAGFWSNHLLAICRFTSGETQPASEWFGDNGADPDARARRSPPGPGGGGAAGQSELRGSLKGLPRALLSLRIRWSVT